VFAEWLARPLCCEDATNTDALPQHRQGEDMETSYYEMLAQLLLTHASGRIDRMAAVAGVSESRMHAWISGEEGPSPAEMERLHAVAGWSCRGPALGASI
jgi:hypothetical protein